MRANREGARGSCQQRGGDRGRLPGGEAGGSKSLGLEQQAEERLTEAPAPPPALWRGARLWDRRSKEAGGGWMGRSHVPGKMHLHWQLMEFL